MILATNFEFARSSGNSAPRSTRMGRTMPLDACPYPLLNHRPLELCKDTEHAEESLSARCSCVDALLLDETPDVEDCCTDRLSRIGSRRCYSLGRMWRQIQSSGRSLLLRNHKTVTARASRKVLLVQTTAVDVLINRREDQAARDGRSVSGRFVSSGTT